ncbi:hypothetical protein [Streptomyces sp. NPDC046939]|uniref:hypothetical protein n=1 Tax=Streptomyces sp. NPDC046939 TaxID=3155376 RepID=UPI00340F4124
MSRTWVRGRRGAAAGAACAAVACLGAAAAFGGGAGPDGYTAVGTGSGGPTPSTAPSGKVRFVPLDPAGTQPPSASRGSTGSKSPGDASAGRDDGSPSAETPGAARSSRQGPGQDAARGAGRSGGGHDTRTGSGSGASAGADPGTAPGPTASAPVSGTPSAPAPASPAALKVGEPVLRAADKRWCQKVTLALRNSGGSAVRSGTVTFGTHIVGSLGIDWATVRSTEELPVPIGAGEEKRKTWTVCVASWRVPLGMHIETRDVSVDWT